MVNGQWSMVNGQCPTGKHDRETEAPTEHVYNIPSTSPPHPSAHFSYSFVQVVAKLNQIL
jgi:hypothetical protein